MHIATLLTEALSLIAASNWFDGMLYAVDKAQLLENVKYSTFRGAGTTVSCIKIFWFVF